MCFLQHFRSQGNRAQGARTGNQRDQSAPRTRARGPIVAGKAPGPFRRPFGVCITRGWKVHPPQEPARVGIRNACSIPQISAKVMACSGDRGAKRSTTEREKRSHSEGLGPTKAR